MPHTRLIFARTVREQSDRRQQSGQANFRPNSASASTYADARQIAPPIARKRGWGGMREARHRVSIASRWTLTYEAPTLGTRGTLARRNQRC
jgi:hypothetical protein